MLDNTIKFSSTYNSEKFTRDTLTEIYQALDEKGYDPINQIVGYLLSEDPTYITNHKNARALIRQLDRDKLLRELVRSYLNL